MYLVCQKSTQLGGKVKNVLEFIISLLIAGFNGIDSAIAHNPSLHQKKKKITKTNTHKKQQHSTNTGTHTKQKQ